MNRRGVLTITITALPLTEQGEIELFEGIVQSIEDNGESTPTGRRWRITMREP